VLKETLAGELIEANCHVRLNCLKRLLNDVTFIWFSVKNSRNGRLYASAAVKNKDDTVKCYFHTDKPHIETGLHQSDIRRFGLRRYTNLYYYYHRRRRHRRRRHGHCRLHYYY